MEVAKRVAWTFHKDYDDIVQTAYYRGNHILQYSHAEVQC